MYFASNMDDVTPTPFIDELKSPFNAVVFLIGITFLVDLLIGSPLMQRFAVFQVGLMGAAPGDRNFQIVTFFGRFKSFEAYARRLDLVGGAVTLGLPGFYYLRGAIRSLLLR